MRAVEYGGTPFGVASAPSSIAARVGFVVACLCVGCSSDRTELKQEPVSEIQRCATCHGDPNRDGDYLVRASPPRDLHGNSDSSAPGVGVHLTHVLGTPRSRAVPCVECHAVPDDPNHARTGPALVVFSGAAVAGGASPSYADGSCSGAPCHGNARPGGPPFGGSNPSPLWTAAGSVESCDRCHGLPPPPPHPASTQCGGCHHDIAPDLTSFLRPDLHVDGQLTFVVH